MRCPMAAISKGENRKRKKSLFLPPQSCRQRVNQPTPLIGGVALKTQPPSKDALLSPSSLLGASTQDSCSLRHHPFFHRQYQNGVAINGALCIESQKSYLPFQKGDLCKSQKDDADSLPLAEQRLFPDGRQTRRPIFRAKKLS
ncbi:hypothetical protein ACFX11_006452 [Malus domestica]